MCAAVLLECVPTLMYINMYFTAPLCMYWSGLFGVDIRWRWGEICKRSCLHTALTITSNWKHSHVDVSVQP